LCEKFSPPGGQAQKAEIQTRKHCAGEAAQKVEFKRAKANSGD
jgi:hypothetical protein